MPQQFLQQLIIFFYFVPLLYKRKELNNNHNNQKMINHSPKNSDTVVGCLFDIFSTLTSLRYLKKFNNRLRKSALSMIKVSNTEKKPNNAIVLSDKE